MNDKATKIALALLLFLLCTVQLVGSYPGYLSHDSAYQWWQARAGETTSVWPPGSIYLLALFDRIWIGPHALYVLQIVVYWICTIVVVAQSASRRGAYLAAFSFALLPIAWICLPHVWTDVHMAVLLFAAVVSIRTASQIAPESIAKKRVLLCMVMLFMLYASIVRHNAIVALAPLVVWWMFVALSKPGAALDQVFSLRRFAKTSLLSLLAFIAIVAFYQTNVRLASKVRADTFAITLIWDLQAISVASNRNLIPPAISENTSVEDLRASYDPLNAVPMYIHSKANWANSTTGLSQDQKVALHDAWRAAVLEHPVAYAKHRTLVFFRTIGVKRDAAKHGGSDDRQRLQFKDNPRHEMVFPALLQSLQHWSDILKRAWWATPLAWIVLSSFGLFALIVSRRRVSHALPIEPRNDNIVSTLAIWVSGALYLASLWFTSPAADLRYALWPTIAMLVAALYAIDFKLRK